VEPGGGCGPGRLVLSPSWRQRRPVRASYPLLFSGATVAGEGAISSPLLGAGGVRGRGRPVPGRAALPEFLSLPSLFRIFGPPPPACAPSFWWIEDPPGGGGLVFGESCLLEWIAPEALCPVGCGFLCWVPRKKRKKMLPVRSHPSMVWFD
jgi:hypothetical protein